MSEKIKAALLISGGGTTAEAVIKACGNDDVPGLEPVLVIASNKSASGIQKVIDHNRIHGTQIITEVLRPKDFLNPTLFGEAMLELLDKYGINLIAQLGWLAKTPPNVIERYKDMIFNQHPGPLDTGRSDFGGTGMYGLAVPGAVLIYGALTGVALPTEATTHRVTNGYDEGTVIQRIPLQTSLFNGEVTQQDQLREAAQEIQTKLLPFEHQNVINTFKSFASGNVPVYRRTEPLIPIENIPALSEAKKLAVTLFSKK